MCVFTILSTPIQLLYKGFSQQRRHLQKKKHSLVVYHSISIENVSFIYDNNDSEETCFGLTKRSNKIGLSWRTNPNLHILKLLNKCTLTRRTRTRAMPRILIVDPIQRSLMRDVEFTEEDTKCCFYILSSLVSLTLLT